MLGIALALAAVVSPAPTMVAVGDIARCGKPGHAATAALVETIPGTVATLGDHAYERGTVEEFQRCYEPTWGRFRARTRPTPGNHEYGTKGASGYFSYFGRRAGRPGRGWYAYRLGTWRIIVLNSNCAHIGGCGSASPQYRWLLAELARHKGRCTLAYSHHPRFSAGTHGDSPSLGPFWQALYRAGADVFLAGHDHNYQRLAPMAPNGRIDRRRGIRQFVVGTGGASHYPIRRPRANTEAHDGETYGVLRLTLRPGGYDFRFVPVEGSTFTDAGSGRCH